MDGHMKIHLRSGPAYLKARLISRSLVCDLVPINIDNERARCWNKVGGK
jgi:hypothetical protein